MDGWRLCKLFFQPRFDLDAFVPSTTQSIFVHRRRDPSCIDYLHAKLLQMRLRLKDNGWWCWIRGDLASRVRTYHGALDSGFPLWGA